MVSQNLTEKSPILNGQQITNSTFRSFGPTHLDISNSILPLEKLSPSPSKKDGLSEEIETQIRSNGCELIQIAGKLLKLPQISMSTGCVLFQRFFRS